MFGLLELSLLLGACGRDAEESAEEPGVLSGAALARRASLDLRGVLPDPEEVAAVQADPEAVDALIATWLEDERLPERMGWLWNDSLHTALWFEDYPRFGALSEGDWRAMGQEPLRLIVAIIREDRPFADLVTARTLPADDTLAAWWGLTRAAGEGWTEATPQDGRPMAGILSSTSLWNRYNADITNRNRMRANTVARVLLCADHLDRDVSFDFDLSTEALAQVEDAVREEPSCLACHAALDPLAAFFGGFAERSQEEDLETFRAWSAWNATWYAAWTPPAYYGHPGADLEDLGAMIAADPRFSTCAASRFYEGLVGEALTDPEVRASLGQRFRDSGLDVRALLAEILASDAWRADEDRVPTNEQLGLALSTALGLDPEDALSPLSWSVEHRLLAGGTDDDTVLERNRSPGLASQALMMWAARVAAPRAIALDRARAPAERLLFTAAEPDEAPAEAQVRAQLAAWHVRLLGLPAEPDSAAIDALFDLWSTVEAEGGPELAWEASLAALIRHPQQAVY